MNAGPREQVTALHAVALGGFRIEPWVQPLVPLALPHLGPSGRDVAGPAADGDRREDDAGIGPAVGNDIAVCRMGGRQRGHGRLPDACHGGRVIARGGLRFSTTALILMVFRREND